MASEWIVYELSHEIQLRTSNWIWNICKKMKKKLTKKKRKRISFKGLLWLLKMAKYKFNKKISFVNYNWIICINKALVIKWNHCKKTAKETNANNERQLNFKEWKVLLLNIF